MSIVTLVSGGLDSTVMALLTKEEGLQQFPLFIDYGQLGRAREIEACKRNFAMLDLPVPAVAALPGYGALIRSGLTDPSKDVFHDAFTPGRNMLFLLVGAAYAFQNEASTVGIGLLDESRSLFPDQRSSFLNQAREALSASLGRQIHVAAPLMSLSKADVVAIAKTKGIRNFYSCHAGTPQPCGICIACREYIGIEV